METNRIYFQLFSLNFLLDFGLSQKNHQNYFATYKFKPLPSGCPSAQVDGAQVNCVTTSFPEVREIVLSLCPSNGYQDGVSMQSFVNLRKTFS